MKKIIILLIILLTASMVNAVCINQDDVTRFDLRFEIRDDSLADVYLELDAPVLISQLSECGINESVGSDTVIVGTSCSSFLKTFQDAMFVGMGFFTQGGGECTFDYKEGILTIKSRALTDMVLTNLGNNNYEVTFREWNFTKSANEESLVNKLTIKMPTGAQLSSFYPMNDPVGVPNYETGEIVWEPIPMVKPSVKYNVTGIGAEVFVIIGIIIVVIVIGGVVFLKKNKKGNVKEDKVSQAHLLKAKMKNLETAYLKGTVDEVTYRRLMEQYQLQLNEIRTVLKEIKVEDLKK
ncbi:MAG: LPXTG cell wall anchor domain-containing protein [Candidatus Diapherotrites archaeon]|jgi:LPXTG-motif cell wall-anchored protein|uniref:LPXTG cell wall anchor domain-containing protein n=1 Tax=Candidatus Iainarchaeum sp. TaxID=3101447 RepID=A0A8T5GEL7_9ARCH|nr:LPXTG cell wall anchor domain-containing protein [Candidatus Diapherotrites archaeon]MBT7241320.1 LPXTG cell wall anchor domain-containing protein [Candidatus Diapherotrites archaeon]